MWCFVDGFWKEQNKFREHIWFCRKKDLSGKMMGAMNIWRNLSPLHAECEYRIHKYPVIQRGGVCNLLLSIGKDSVYTGWPAFITHLEEFHRCKEFFTHFSIQHIPEVKNTLADKLAQSARTQSSGMVYVDSIPMC